MEMPATVIACISSANLTIDPQFEVGNSTAWMVTLIDRMYMRSEQVSHLVVSGERLSRRTSPVSLLVQTDSTWSFVQQSGHERTRGRAVESGVVSTEPTGANGAVCEEANRPNIDRQPAEEIRE